MKLYENGAYLVNGRDVVINSPEAASAVNAKTGKTVTPEDAKKQTIAYGILKSHNTSGNMEKLQIKFDKLTSHDITFISISLMKSSKFMATCCALSRPSRWNIFHPDRQSIRS